MDGLGGDLGDLGPQQGDYGPPGSSGQTSPVQSGAEFNVPESTSGMMTAGLTSSLSQAILDVLEKYNPLSQPTTDKNRPFQQGMTAAWGTGQGLLGPALGLIGMMNGPMSKEQMAALASQVPLGREGGVGPDMGSEPFHLPTAIMRAMQPQTAANAPAGIGTMPEMLRPELYGLTPFQQRAAIGTYGTSSESGRYRDPQTIDYYRSLVENTLKNEMGIPIGSPLPIEWQFLRQVLGTDVPQDTTEGFLSALANYQTPI